MHPPPSIPPTGRPMLQPEHPHQTPPPPAPAPAPTTSCLMRKTKRSTARFTAGTCRQQGGDTAGVGVLYCLPGGAEPLSPLLPTPHRPWGDDGRGRGQRQGTGGAHPRGQRHLPLELALAAQRLQHARPLLDVLQLQPSRRAGGRRQGRGRSGRGTRPNRGVRAPKGEDLQLAAQQADGRRFTLHGRAAPESRPAGQAGWLPMAAPSTHQRLEVGHQSVKQVAPEGQRPEQRLQELAALLHRLDVDLRYRRGTGSGTSVQHSAARYGAGRVHR